MSQFLIRLSDKQRHLMTEDLLRGHVAFLRQLCDEGRLVHCGFCDDGTAQIIMEAESAEQARALLARDPFNQQRYYQTVDIVGFHPATPENNFELDSALAFMRSPEYQAALRD